MNYYEILGIALEATDDDIRKSYRALARQYHPDRNPGDAASEEKFKQVASAYEVLSDPLQKSQYDLRIPRPAPKQSAKTKEDFEQERAAEKRREAKKSTYEELNEINCSYFGGGGTGRNVLVQLKLTDKEKIYGCTKIVKVKKRDLCSKCVGDGQANVPCPRCSRLREIDKYTWCQYCSNEGYVEIKCPTCNGEGVQRYYIHDMKVYISPGAQSGHTVNVLGEGEAAPHKPPGNVRVVVV